MRHLALLFLLFGFAHVLHAQENPRYELRHIRLEAEMSQHDFAMTYNICWEQVHQHLRYQPVFMIPADTDLYFPPDMLPCYNEAGQRLIFYENGAQVLEPYYSDRRVYTTVKGETIESLTRAVNVCIEDIVLQNEHYFYPFNGMFVASFLNTHPFARGQELFIPDRLPCYNENGQKLAYLGEETVALEGRVFFFQSYSLMRLSYKFNICPELLLDANHLSGWSNPGYYSIGSIVIPNNAPTCYQIYQNTDYPTLRSTLDVCESEIHSDSIYRRKGWDVILYVRLDAEACSDEERALWLQSQPIIVPEGATLASLSFVYNICPKDLLEANYNREPSNGGNYVIPKTRTCYDEMGDRIIYAEDGSWLGVNSQEFMISPSDSLESIAWEYNVCLSDLLDANPDLNIGDELYLSDSRDNRAAVLMIRHGHEVNLPQTAACYEEFFAANDDELWYLSQELNLCIEQLKSWRRVSNVYMIPRDRLLCYDENGHRLSYFDESGQAQPEPIRLENEIYVVPEYISAYELSRRLNVCVNDLLPLNPILMREIPYPHLEIFIPETLPCYDEATGKQLLYIDEYGEALDEPRLSDYLIHQVTAGSTWATLTKLYNVCTNRLLDYNADFLPNVWTVSPFGTAEYIADPDGIFDVGVYVRIPTDRPPCFEYSVSTPLIRYVCYDEPIDMSIENPDAVINFDGTACYDIEDPTTVIWHKGDRYLYQKREGNLYTNDFMAWCFGVEEDDIIAAAENEILFIWPYDELIVRNPSRPCYAREYDGMENVHWVTQGETLRTIAWQYGKLPEWIAEANHLSDPNLIWEYQRLVIPEGINLWELVRGISVFTGVIGIAFLSRVLLKRRQQKSMKKKNR